MMPLENLSLARPESDPRAPLPTDETTHEMAADPYPAQPGEAIGGVEAGGPQAFLNADSRDGVAANGKLSYTIDQAANQIIRGEPGWSQSLGAPFTVTYAYRANAPATMPDDAGG